MSRDTLVSIGLPVRNAGPAVAETVQSVLRQTHRTLELVISDNASTDDTEDVCRALAKADDRISYHRQPENIGLMNNFIATMRLANGTFFRWIGDDDSLAPDYVGRCLEVFEDDPRLVLVSTGISYSGPDGEALSEKSDHPMMASDDPAERFVQVMRLLDASYLVFDPMYALMRRESVVGIPRRNMLREDQVFATKLALAGPWGHVPDMLAHRHWDRSPHAKIARLLDVPAWQSHFINTIQCWEILAWVNQSGLARADKSRARQAVYRLYANRQRGQAIRGARKLRRIVTRQRAAA